MKLTREFGLMWWSTKLRKLRSAISGLLRLRVDFVCSLFVVISVKSLSIWRGDRLNLDWPDIAVLPVILDLKGLLVGDPYALESLNSPYLVAAEALNFVLPSEFPLVIRQYALYSFLLEVLVILLSAWLLVEVSKLLISISSRSNELISSLGYSAIWMLSTSLVLANHYGIFDGLGFGSVFISRIGGWGFPLHDSLNPSGLSFALVLLGVSVLVRNRHRTSIVFPIVGIVIFFMASLLHPVVALAGPMLLASVVVLVSHKEHVRKILVPTVFLSAGSVLTGQVAVLVFFPQATVGSDEDFIRIFAYERHPHHLVPSVYVPEMFPALFLTVAVCLLPILIGAEKKIQIKLLALFSGYVVLFQGFQWIVVEILGWRVATMLTLNRLSGVALVFPLMSILILAIWVTSRMPISLKVPGLEQSLRPVVGSGAFLIILILVTALFGNNWSEAFRASPELRIADLVPRTVNPIFINNSDEANSLKLRELTLSPVWFDGYFPFSNQGVFSWDQRRQTSEMIDHFCETGENAVLDRATSAMDFEGGLTPVFLFPDTCVIGPSFEVLGRVGGIQVALQGQAPKSSLSR